MLPCSSRLIATVLAVLLAGPSVWAQDDPPGTPEAEPALWQRPSVWIGVISAGVVGGGALNAFLDDPQGGFRTESEGWFGEHTYAGGADKASHFVSFEVLAHELDGLYRMLGMRPQPARLLGTAVSALTGLIVEIGDGTNEYGFSYEDLVMDFAGAGTAWMLSRFELNDLIGFRFGILPGSAPPKAVDGVGRDYSHEIYTADLKLAGLTQRLGIELGPVRYLLLSLTYGSKGYPYAASADRERQLGFEVGLNFGAILDELDVRRDTWWGSIAHLATDDFRIPYTAGGFRYDFNHHDWHGPDTGNSCRGC